MGDSPSPREGFANRQEIEAFLRGLLTGNDSKHYPSVIGAVRSILVKGGIRPLYFRGEIADESYILRYLSRSFLFRLAQSVKANRTIRESFPIVVSAVSVESVGPFPLREKDTLLDFGLLSLDVANGAERNSDNPHKLTDWRDRDISTLAKRHSYRVTVQFQVRFTQDELRDCPELYGQEAFQRMIEVVEDRVHFNFAVSSSGIGGTLSQVIKILNKALIGDITCLRDYFPIAHDVMINQVFEGNNVSSPTWSHSLALLCDRNFLCQAMNESARARTIRPYGQFAYADVVGRGDYCEFDLLLSSTRAVLQSRLQAIKATGIDPETYIRQLCRRVVQQDLLHQARSRVTSYPFSTLAQQAQLQTANLLKHDGQTGEAVEIIYDAYLTMAETFLVEGGYRQAYPYLHQLATTFEFAAYSSQGRKWLNRFERGQGDGEDEFELFSGARLIRYELCRAAYYYQLDLDFETQERSEYLWELASQGQDLSQTRLIAEYAWDALNSAEDHVQVRLAKYTIINEYSQARFTPHHQLLAQIYFLRAKLLIFFPRKVPKDQQPAQLRIPLDICDAADSGMTRKRVDVIRAGQIYLLEKARVYAGSDGNSALYAYYTSYQCWAYIMAAFSSLETPVVRCQHSEYDLDFTLTQGECLERAKQLRDHAIVFYAETGRRCYYRIKEKSGLKKSSQETDETYAIEDIPVLRESFHEGDAGLNILQPQSASTEEINVLNLDMLLQSVRRADVQGSSGNPDETIYLFGPNACYLYFARGLFHLCSDNKHEFLNKDDKTDMDTQLETLEDWINKLTRAHRLFNYAWAIADDGCNLETVSTPDDGATVDSAEPKFRVSRNFKPVGDERGEVFSVRELYPHRVTEIADLGRIFAAVSLKLLLLLQTKEARASYQQEIESLLEDVHAAQRCRLGKSQSSQALLGGQIRYNGNLQEYLQDCKDAIRRLSVPSDGFDSLQTRPDQVKEIRNQLLRDIFAAGL